MPLLRGCCGNDLQVGTKTIGIIFLVINLISLPVFLVMLLAFVMLKDVFFTLLEETLLNERNDQEKLGQNATEIQVQLDIVEYGKRHAHVVIIVLVIFTCVELLNVIVDSCLIHGVRKNRRGLLIPWISVNSLWFIVAIVEVVALFVCLGYWPGLYRLLLPSIASVLLWSALHIYLILVVISQHQALGLIRMHDEMCMK